MKDFSEESFQLEIGSLHNLKGNAVIYWNVNQNSFNEESDEESIHILAVNFVISIFPLDDNLVTATFPPVGFKDREEFMLYIRHSQCDLIFAGELSLNKDADYQRNLPDEQYYILNRILNSYLEFYRENMDGLILSMSLKEQLYLLKKLIINFRAALNNKENKEKRVQIPVNFNRIRKLIINLKQHFSPFDVENFQELITIPGKQINKTVELYLEKFISIHYEDYEKASTLTQQIEKARLKMENKKKQKD